MKTIDKTGNTQEDTLKDFSGREYVNVGQRSPPQHQKLTTRLAFPLPPKPQTNGVKPVIPPKPKNVVPSIKKISTGTQVTLIKKSSFKSKAPNTLLDKSANSEVQRRESEPTEASPSLTRAVKTEDETIISKPNESVSILKEKFESPNCRRTVIEHEEKIYIKKTKVRKSIQTVIKPIIAPKPSPKPILKNKNPNASNSVTFATDCEPNSTSQSDSKTNITKVVKSKHGIFRSNSLPATSAPPHKKEPKYVSKHGKKSVSRDGSFVTKNNRRNAAVYNNSQIRNEINNKNDSARNNNNNISDEPCSIWNWCSDQDPGIEVISEEREPPTRSVPSGAIVFSGWKKSKTFPVFVNRRPPTISPIPSENRPFSQLKPNSDFVSLRALNNHPVNLTPITTELAVRPKTTLGLTSLKLAAVTPENKSATPAKVPVPPPRRRKSLILFPPNFSIFSLCKNSKTKDQNEVPDTKNPDASGKSKSKNADANKNNTKEKIAEPKKTKPKAPDPPALPQSPPLIAEIPEFKPKSTPTSTPTPIPTPSPSLTSTPTSTETETESPESEDQQKSSPKLNPVPPKSPHIYAKVNRNGKTGGGRRNFKKLNKTNARYNNDYIEKTSLLADRSTIICYEIKDPIDSDPFLPPAASDKNKNEIENTWDNKTNSIQSSKNNKIKLNPICENEYEIIEDCVPTLSLTELKSEIETVPLSIMDGLKKATPGCFESSLKSQCLNNKKKSIPLANSERNQNAQEKIQVKSLSVPTPVLPTLRLNQDKNEETQKENKKDVKESDGTIQELPSNRSFLFTCMNTPVVSTYQNPFFTEPGNSTETPVDVASNNENDENQNATRRDVNENDDSLSKVDTATSGAAISVDTVAGSVNETTDISDISSNKINTTVEASTNSRVSENSKVHTTDTDTDATDSTEDKEIPKVLVSDCDAETPTNSNPHPPPVFEFQEGSLLSEMTSLLDKMGTANSMTKQTDHVLEKPNNSETNVNSEGVKQGANNDTGSRSRSGTSVSEEDEEGKEVAVALKANHNSGLLDFVDKEIQKVQTLLAEFCPPPPPPAPPSPSLTASSSTSTSTSASKPPETPKSSKKTKAYKKSFKLDIPKSVLLRKSSVPELFIAASSIALSSAVGGGASTSGDKGDDEQKKLLRRSWATKSTSSVGSTTSSSSTGSKSNTKDKVNPDALTGNATGSSKSLTLPSSNQNNNHNHGHGHSHYKGRRLSDISQFFWVDEGETSTGAIGDNENSPLHSSNEEITSLESSSTGRSVYRRRRTVADFFDKARKTSIASLWRPNHSSFHGSTASSNNSGNSLNADSGRVRKVSKVCNRNDSKVEVIHADNSSVGSGSTDGGNGGAVRRLSSDDDEQAENVQWEENETKKKTEAEQFNKLMVNLSPKAKKAFYVVREILTSEKTFVDVLRLLTIDFPKSLKKTSKKMKTSEVSIIPQQDLDYILGGLPILKGVNEDLLHDLEERIAKWEEGSKIADIFVKKGAFLKHYTYYIKDFEKISRFFDNLCCTNSSFASAVKDFELKRNCHNLGLKPFMLKPVQRMPQYSLLLEDYLKHLDEDHVDFEDTVKAIGIVRAVAEHANEAIRNQMTWERLVNLQHRVPGVDLLGEDKQLIKDGELMKVCRKELQPRYFALMSDCLLCMAYHSSSTKDLKVKYKLPLTRMKIMLNPNEEHQYEFSIIGLARSFIVVAKSGKQREEWMEALTQTVNEYMKRRPSFVPGMDMADKELMLGKQAPIWIQDSRTSMCQVCAYEFNIVFRRHHCRSCGKVVCRHCSANEAPLKYLEYEAVRVCDPCYDVLLNEIEAENVDKDSAEFLQNRLKFKKFNMSSTPSTKKASSSKPLNKRTIKLPLKSQINKGSDAVAKFKGYLQWKEKRVWRRNWFVLIDCILYVFTASEDVAAIQTLPVLGYTVEKGGAEDGADEDLSFKLKHKGRGAIIFQAESTQLAIKWMEALNEVTTLKDS